MSAEGPITKFVFMRHGQSAFGEVGLLAGRQDPELSLLGQEQARRARPSVEEYGPYDVVLSSPLKRAVRTIELVAGEKPKTDIRLIEQGLGNLEGRQSSEEIRRGVSRPFDRRNHPIAPDAETDAEVLNRLGEFFYVRGPELAGKNILVGSHGRVIRAVASMAGAEGVEITQVFHTALLVVEATGKPRAPRLEVVYTNGITPDLVTSH